MEFQATYLFATKADLLPGLAAVECQRDLKYVEMIFANSPHYAVYDSALEIEPLAISENGDAVHDTRYLVMDRRTRVRLERIRQVRGGLRYSVGILKNRKALIWQPGGEYQNCVIRGEISAEKTRFAGELFEFFVNAVTAGFITFEEHWIGDQAARLFQAGKRLTASASFPRLGTC